MAEQERGRAARRGHPGLRARGRGSSSAAPVAIPPQTRTERARRSSRYVLMVALALLYLVPLVWTFSRR